MPDLYSPKCVLAWGERQEEVGDRLARIDLAAYSTNEKGWSKSRSARPRMPALDHRQDGDRAARRAVRVARPHDSGQVKRRAGR